MASPIILDNYVVIPLVRTKLHVIRKSDNVTFDLEVPRYVLIFPLEKDVICLTKDVGALHMFHLFDLSNLGKHVLLPSVLPIQIENNEDVEPIPNSCFVQILKSSKEKEHVYYPREIIKINALGDIIWRSDMDSFFDKIAKSITNPTQITNLYENDEKIILEAEPYYLLYNKKTYTWSEAAQIHLSGCLQNNTIRVPQLSDDKLSNSWIIPHSDKNEIVVRLSGKHSIMESQYMRTVETPRGFIYYRNCIIFVGGYSNSIFLYRGTDAYIYRGTPDENFQSYENRLVIKSGKVGIIRETVDARSNEYKRSTSPLVIDFNKEAMKFLYARKYDEYLKCLPHDMVKYICDILKYCIPFGYTCVYKEHQ